MDKSKTTTCIYCKSKDDYYLTTTGKDNCTNCEKPIWVGRIDGGPAFPVSNDAEDEGLTLRDYFAGQAVPGLCSSTDREGTYMYGNPEDIADTAYRIADAMLKEREK